MRFRTEVGVTSLCVALCLVRRLWGKDCYSYPSRVVMLLIRDAVDLPCLICFSKCDPVDLISSMWSR